MNDDSIIVAWDDSYATGIQLIDQQHMELVSLTNELYSACLSGRDTAGPVFKKVMSRMVEYVRFHFSAEMELLKKVNYPNYNHHKSLHDALVKQILSAVKEFNEGQKYAPNHFVRTLKDWIFGHIVIEDRIYASYIAGMRKKGLIEDKDLV